MENIAQSKLEALLSFYNLFSEKLSLEDCDSLIDTRYLLHSVANYIKSGDLVYENHANFGFKDVVDFLKKQELPDTFLKQLNCERAEEKDPFEIVKILVALCYEFRLSRTDDFSNFVNQLKPIHNEEIADMVTFLDRNDLWSSSDGWVHALRGPGKGDVASEKSENNSSPATTPRISMDMYKKISKSASVLSPPRARLFYKAPMNLSPIMCALNSPRGAEVTKLKQLQRKYNELKESMETLQKEKFCIEEILQGYKDELALANEEILNLTKRLNTLKCQNENFMFMDEKLKDAEAENSKLRGQVQQLLREVTSLTSTKEKLVFERNEAQSQVANLEDECACLQLCINTANIQLSEELKMHNNTRNLLLKTQQEFAEMKQKERYSGNDLLEQLHINERNLKMQLEEKDKEIVRLMEMAMNKAGGNNLGKFESLQQQLKQREMELSVAMNDNDKIDHTDLISSCEMFEEHEQTPLFPQSILSDNPEPEMVLIDNDPPKRVVRKVLRINANDRTRVN